MCAPQFFKTQKGLCGHTVYSDKCGAFGITLAWKTYVDEISMNITPSKLLQLVYFNNEDCKVTQNAM
jgi:hypothetical protein